MQNEWMGGQCPVAPEVWVEVTTRRGDKEVAQAGGFDWDHELSEHDIVSYRVTNGATHVKDTNPKDAIGSRKAKVSVIPMGVIFELGLAMLEGAGKYRRHNYRVAGVRASVYFDAAMGHLMDYWEGQDIDPDSGRLHLVKAMASLAVWIDAIQQGMLTDDRPPRSKITKADFNAAAAEIIDRMSALPGGFKPPYTLGDA